MNLTHSESIKEIAGALARAQAVIEGAAKDTANPYFKSKYADLSSVWAACRKALTGNGIAVVQSPHVDGQRVSVDTLLTHASGEWIAGTVTAEAKDAGPQAVGSAVTYLRRYALQSFVGVAPEDDDAEAAEGRKTGQTAKPVAVAPKGYDEWLTDLTAVAYEGTARLQEAWKASKDEYRRHLTTTDGKTWDGLKLHAANVSMVAKAKETA